jgi:hypothetical protein
MAWVDVGIAAVEVGSEIGAGAGAAGAFDLGALGFGADAGMGFAGPAFEVGNFGAMDSLLGGASGLEGLGGLYGLGGDGTLSSVGGSFAGQSGFTLPQLSADVVGGGAGAGGVGVNAAQVGAAENIATGAGAGGAPVAPTPTPTPTFTPSAVSTPDVLPSSSYTTGGYGPEVSGPQIGTPEAVASNVPNPAPTGGGLGGVGDTLKNVGSWIGENPGKTAAGLMLLSAMMPRNSVNIPNAQFQGSNPLGLKSLPSNFKGQYPAQPTPYQAQYRNYVQNPYNASLGYASGGQIVTPEGGQIGLPPGGPVEQMSRDNALGQNQMFPQARFQTDAFSVPTNMPMGTNLIASDSDTNVDPYTGEEKFSAGGQPKVVKPKHTAAAKMAAMPADQAAVAGFDNANYNAQMPTGVASGLNPTMQLGQLNLASGGIASLGGYSDGGQLLKGPGDGMSDSIPAKIGHKQPARLADGEFVVPADVVSHLGNGSTDAGAKHLYKMMDRIRQDRTGRKAQGKQINPAKYMPK